MPGAVAHDRLPVPAATMIFVPITLIRERSAVLGRGEDVDGFTRVRAVEVPDVDFAVVRAGVDVPSVSRAGRGEVAADEGFEDAVAAEGDEGAVVGVGLVVFDVVGGEAVVEVGCVVLLQSCQWQCF